MDKQGLILVVGATGTGKSTTLASLIEYRNQNSHGHIITIEDPIEYMYVHNKSLINQREVGDDTSSYKMALRNALRQSPDVILIGEIRSRSTMKYALQFAETGHLCLSTLHAVNANQAIERVLNFFPQSKSQQVLFDLSLNLKAVVSQRLVQTVHNRLTAVFEILVVTPYIRDLIKKNSVKEIKEAMMRSDDGGMQLFDKELIKLYEANTITKEEALLHADSKNDVRLAIQMKTNF